MHHHLKSSPESVHWGWFDAALPHAITIDSGDSVTIEALSGGPANLPGEGFHVPPELLHVHEKSQRRLPGHILTGPVGVRGAMPGDVLEVRILDVRLRQDWGYTFVRPLAGALPGEIDAFEQIITRLDGERNVGTLPWGLEIPLRPFFGVMGVSPPKAWGSISSIQPRAHGGNLDNKELIPGATLYLPVFNEGAGFSVGDGHAVQGDGEVCTTAIETALTGTFEIHLRKDLRLDYPAAETPTHLVTMGMDPDLDTAAKDALRRMVDRLVQETGLSRPRALMLMSLVADVRVSQLVNEHKGIHVMCPKSALSPQPAK
ncbi:acetamidase/formamidase family protein [Caenimonas aquaedulcis]|uniref:Acetamidase/formamidase family protein n=1 Tax=Caenimonas aquaedulcis TaxID=2793270 RepID=A0A931H4F6_9BURK|nr:acetamidase/formamidase family protein [Caenimonas aquaedulcis]MBG9388435.1 acetamidase/formamidase family protein [Caenimonas aquaedulcis]